jgi:hypothetical protein
LANNEQYRNPGTTLFVAHISLQTQKLQAASEERQNASEQQIKKQELLNEILKMATDNSAGQDLRIAGIRALGQFWPEQAYEETMASTLAAELGLEGDNERFARCAAADYWGSDHGRRLIQGWRQGR